MMPRADLMKDGETSRGFSTKKEITSLKASNPLPMRTLTRMAPRKRKVPTTTLMLSLIQISARDNLILLEDPRRAAICLTMITQL